MSIRSISTAGLLLSILSGCASDTPPRPATIWGGVGFAYEADKISGGTQYDLPVATTHIGLEKDLGNGVGIGVEVAGAASD